ncbi:Hypothetical predicted protein [Cloeon dipterum]|uniref:40S ribosomal protein S19 n=1 Tax=Cloeon dipterum TaxID=197152 RepID=A0A8S1BW47_9INSE|nr:Hypothetical predicted protein [Cloeon dipterum]
MRSYHQLSFILCTVTVGRGVGVSKNNASCYVGIWLVYIYRSCCSMIMTKSSIISKEAEANDRVSLACRCRLHDPDVQTHQTKTIGVVHIITSSFEMPSVTVKDVDQHKFVRAFAAFLKMSGKMKVPDWVDLVKTAKFKELAPYDEDWYFTRCSAIARHMYIRAPIGVGSITKIFGGKLNLFLDNP